MEDFNKMQTRFIIRGIKKSTLQFIKSHAENFSDQLESEKVPEFLKEIIWMHISSSLCTHKKVRLSWNKIHMLYMYLKQGPSSESSFDRPSENVQGNTSSDSGDPRDDPSEEDVHSGKDLSSDEDDDDLNIEEIIREFRAADEVSPD